MSQEARRNIAATAAGFILGAVMLFWTDWFFSSFQAVNITIELVER